MSSQTIDLLFGVTGQSLYFDCPEGRPSSVTSSTVWQNAVGDDGASETATTGSAAVETNPNTTFDAASGEGQANPVKCNLTATAGCAAGRTYLATNAFGQSDRIEVAAVAAADYVLAREPLQNAYAAADTFVSTRITHALDSTWIASVAKLSDPYEPNPKYRWRLVYVVGGVTYAQDAYFDLLRYAGRYDVSPGDVDRRFPGWIDRLPTNYRDDQGRSLIDAAWLDIKFDLYNLSTADQSIRNREVVNELVTLRAGYLVDMTPENAGRYQDRLSQLVAWAKASVQTSSSGAAGAADVRTVWRR